jgi:ABC-2 type transport system ATP-binding protein
MVGLAGVAHRPVGEFSKGMMRRIGLAQALVNDPDFLILDEPTSGLDPIGTRQVKDLIMDLRARGKTILLSSHLLGDVQDVCDRMVMLYGGRIRASGTVNELLQDTESTIIRTGRLDQATIQRIDEVLRSSGHVIEQVESPRQPLEKLFLDIVEQARRERIETSGATTGGDTAEFLQAGPAEGADLVEQLATAEDRPQAAKVVVQDEEMKDDGSGAVLESLMNDSAPTPTPAKKRESIKPAADSAVDSSIIDKLMGEKPGGGSGDSA